MNLTTRQKTLLIISKNKGSLNLINAKQVYTSELSRSIALDRLSKFGLIKRIDHNVWEITFDGIKYLQNNMK